MAEFIMGGWIVLRSRRGSVCLLQKKILEKKGEMREGEKMVDRQVIIKYQWWHYRQNYYINNSIGHFIDKNITSQYDFFFNLFVISTVILLVYILREFFLLVFTNRYKDKKKNLLVKVITIQNFHLIFLFVLINFLTVK